MRVYQCAEMKKLNVWDDLIHCDNKRKQSEWIPSGSETISSWKNQKNLKKKENLKKLLKCASNSIS
jgi:hypothetical protein